MVVGKSRFQHPSILFNLFNAKTNTSLFETLNLGFQSKYEWMRDTLALMDDPTG